MQRVVFVGLTCFDVVSVVDHWPSEDSDTQVKEQALRRGGNASNSSTCFASLIKWRRRTHACDYEVEFFGTMGGDVAAEFMERDMKSAGIITENVVKYPDSSSAQASIIINKSNGSRTIFYCHKNVPELSASDFMEKLDPCHYSWMHMEARKNAPEIVKMIRYAISSAAAAAKTLRISIEIEKPSKSREVYFTEDIDYFFISKDYAKWKGATCSSESIEAVVHMIPKDRNVVLICAWAEMGARAAVIESGRIQKQYSAPCFTPRTGVIDTTGAGDSFVAATVFALQVLQHDPGEAIRFGCRFAGAKCGVMGNTGLDNFDQIL